MNDVKRRFIQGNFSALIPPVLLIAVALISLRIFLFHRSSREHQVELSGHLANVKVIRGRTDAQNILEIKIKEYPHTFIANRMQPIDQQLLMTTERAGNEVKFSVEKKRIEDNSTQEIPLLKLSSRQNVYVKADNTAEVMGADRGVALFFFAVSAAASYFLARRLQKKYAELLKAAKAGGPPPTEEFDEYVLWAAKNPQLAGFVGTLIIWVFLNLFLPGSNIVFSTILSAVCYGSYLGWFKKKGKDLPIFQKVADFEKVEEEKRKANHVATAAPKHVQAVQILLKRGIDINIKNANGQSALHLSILHNSPEAVDLLLRSGADVNLVDNAGESPLMLAAKAGSVGIVTKLLEKGADVLYKTSSGQTTLTAAETNKKNEAVIHVIKQAIAAAEAKLKAQAEAEALKKQISGGNG